MIRRYTTTRTRHGVSGEFLSNPTKVKMMRSPSQLALGLSLLAFLVAGSGAAAQPNEIKLPDKQKFHLFLLVGQSNMAGRGKVEPQDRKPHSRVLVLRKNNQWDRATDPLHFDKSSAGVGLGKTFGAIIAEADPGITVGLIPCAAGGSPIASWEPGGYHSQTKSHPYDDALIRAAVAFKAGTLKGILWHQGESDASGDKAKIYKDKLHALIARFRRELDSPEVPFIAGQMGQLKERPWNEAKQLVDAAHRNLPQAVPHSACVVSAGLSHKGDKVHFDSKSYRELGKRYAAAYLEMTK
ncbi:MAG: sialate O-acetylesterase [Planctomycetales bacterium]